jgi:hypothetical protein
VLSGFDLPSDLIYPSVVNQSVLFPSLATLGSVLNGWLSSVPNAEGGSYYVFFLSLR